MSLASTIVAISEGFIPMDKWGKDHWSTLAYVETRIVDHHGKLKEPNMRGRDPKYPTRLNDGTEVHMHSDYDCVEDMIFAGVITVDDYTYSLTDYGWTVAGALRKHIAITHKSATFTPPEKP